jgi:soluble lytic murein transglycosylase-like protein
MKIFFATPVVTGCAIAAFCFFLSPWRTLPAKETAIITQAAARIPEKLASIKALDVHALIRAAAQKHRVPEAFIKSIVAVESNFNANAVSPKGAIGLMQLMPALAQEYHADPTIPEQNIDAGTHYISALMTRYRKSPLSHVIAAYNAGPGAVDRYRGVPPYRETRQYVVRVLANMKRFQRELRP